MHVEMSQIAVTADNNKFTFFFFCHCVKLLVIDFGPCNFSEEAEKYLGHKQSSSLLSHSNIRKR